MSTPNLVRHDMTCRDRGRGHDDPARRISDQYRLHRMADVHEAVGMWFAARLSDGTGDGSLYPSKSVCAKRQKGDPRLYAYVQIVPADMSVCEASLFLRTQRKLYDAGIQVVDPDARGGGMQPIPRVTNEDQLAFLRSLKN